MAFKTVARKSPSFFEGLRVRDSQATVDGADEESIHELLFTFLGHEQAASKQERINLAIRSVILAQCLRVLGYFGSNPDESQVKLISTLIYDLQFIIAHNIHRVYNLSGPVDGTIPMEAIGSALYR